MADRPRWRVEGLERALGIANDAGRTDRTSRRSFRRIEAEEPAVVPTELLDELRRCGRGDDRSAKAMKDGWACRRAGLSSGEVKWVLVHESRALRAKWADPDQAERQADRIVSKVAAGRLAGLDEPGSALHECWRVALAHPWPGQAGESRRFCYLAVLLLADRSGRRRVDASVREVAEAAGVAKDTAATALRWLCDNDWLVLLKRFRPAAAAATYEVVDQRGLVTHTSQEPSPDGVGACVLTLLRMESDAFNHGGLNRTGLLVFASLLASDGESKSSLAAMWHKHPTTIATALKRLQEDGLVEEAGGLWRPIEDEELTDLLNLAADSRGVAERRVRRKVRHELERDAHEGLLRAWGVNPDPGALKKRRRRRRRSTKGR